MTLISVDDVRYGVRVGGAGSPLLLLHGFTGRGSGWGAHLPYFRRTATTIVVDLLGHGRSSAPTDPARHAVERQAADMAAIIEGLGFGPADVIGYSFGARIALTLALDTPAAVRRLVLESPSAGIADSEARRARRLSDEALADRLERDGTAAFVDGWEALPLFEVQRSLSPARRRLLHEGRLRNQSGALAASLRGAGQGAMMPLHDRLSQVPAPTLVVAGSLDPVLDRARYVAANIPNSRLTVIAGAGHAPHIERPAQFRAAVTPFLAAPIVAIDSNAWEIA
jgi:2-succinyl-6-hydroxy-2,4-cyclohexadiene-1-carboxylate synthase